MFLNIIKLFAGGISSELSFNTLTGISLLQFTGLVLYKLFLIAKHYKRVIITKCQRESSEDELEHFEMAAAETEIESESDGEEQLGNDDNMDSHVPQA